MFANCSRCGSPKAEFRRRAPDGTASVLCEDCRWSVRTNERFHRDRYRTRIRKGIPGYASLDPVSRILEELAMTDRSLAEGR